jgi:glycosyltransferase involved in cell wall biosynthesis
LIGLKYCTRGAGNLQENSKMKIMMVISEAPPVKSGVACVADHLSSGLINRGHQVDILSLNDIPRVEWGEIRISSMPVKISQLKEKFSEYDIINLHGPVPTFSDIFLLFGLRGITREKPRLIFTYHAPVDIRSLPLQPFIWAYNKSQEWLARLADHVIVTTPSYGQRLSRFVSSDKLSVIPWGVDFERYVSPVNKEGPFTVLYTGQIRPYKGLPVLLDAVQGLDNTRVWVIGDGHFAEACRQQAKALNLSSIKFWGQVSDIEKVNLTKQSDVIVLPSVTRSEAFGIVLLEGMAAGLVPVASHLPGVADLVGNEGFTFPPGNRKALREAIVRLRDDKILRNYMAGLAQAKARLYSWERVIFGYERIFHKQVFPLLRGQKQVPGEITKSPIMERYMK